MLSAPHRTVGLTGARRVYRAAALGAAVLLLTGCGSSSTGPAAKPPATPAASPSSPDPTATAKQQVLAAYQGMFDAEIKALNTNSLANSDLETYAIENQLSDIKGAIFQNMQDNVVMTGQPTYNIRKVTVDLASVPHTASITLCFDNKNWTPIDKTTRKSVAAPGQLQRYINTARLRTFGTRWVVIDGTVDRGRRC